MTAPAQRAGWHSLPEELQLAILLRLSATDRRLTASVCRQWEGAVRAQQRRLRAGSLTGEEKPEDIAALLSGVAKRSSQLEDVSVEIAKPEGWAPLVALLSRLEPTTLRQLEVFGKACTGVLPTRLTLHLRGLRSLHLDGLVSAPSGDALGELTTLTSLQLAGFGNELDKAPYGPMMDLPDSLTALRLLRRVSIHGSDRSSGFLPFTPLCEWMLLANAEVLGELPALANAEFVGLVVPHLDWLQALRGVTRLRLYSLRWCAAPGFGETEDPPHFSAPSFSTALQPLTQLRAHLAARLCRRPSPSSGAQSCLQPTGHAAPRALPARPGGAPAQLHARACSAVSARQRLMLVGVGPCVLHHDQVGVHFQRGGQSKHWLCGQRAGACMTVRGPASKPPLRRDPNHTHAGAGNCHRRQRQSPYPRLPPPLGPRSRDAAPVLQAMPKLGVLGTCKHYTVEDPDFQAVLLQLLPGLTALQVLYLESNVPWACMSAVRAAFPALDVRRKALFTEELPFECEEAEAAAPAWGP